MNILLTNDDGFAAPGIWALANRLKKNHRIFIVAPDSERSGASHSASFFSSLSYEYKGNIDGVEVYSISGTPADCIVFSVKYLLKDVLKTHWHYDGVVVSDWGAVNGIVEAHKNGLDLEMPCLCGKDRNTVLYNAIRRGQFKSVDFKNSISRPEILVID